MSGNILEPAFSHWRIFSRKRAKLGILKEEKVMELLHAFITVCLMHPSMGEPVSCEDFYEPGLPQHATLEACMERAEYGRKKSLANIAQEPSTQRLQSLGYSFHITAQCKTAETDV